MKSPTPEEEVASKIPSPEEPPTIKDIAVVEKVLAEDLHRAPVVEVEEATNVDGFFKKWWSTVVTIAVIALAITGVVALMVNDFKNRRIVYSFVGQTATVAGSNVTVKTIAWSDNYKVMICRVDNGVGASPRFSEVRFNINELTFNFTPEK